MQIDEPIPSTSSGITQEGRGSNLTKSLGLKSVVKNERFTAEFHKIAHRKLKLPLHSHQYRLVIKKPEGTLSQTPAIKDILEGFRNSLKSALLELKKIFKDTG